jgi:hypothetical protein
MRVVTTLSYESSSQHTAAPGQLHKCSLDSLQLGSDERGFATAGAAANKRQLKSGICDRHPMYSLLSWSPCVPNSSARIDAILVDAKRFCA